MTMKQTLIILILTTVINGNAQTIITDLNGFRIGQYRETASNEFGAPAKHDKYEDGFEYELFIIRPDTSLYMVFEYASGHSDIIWSIQISGYDTKEDIGFMGLKLGMDKEGVKRIIGEPNSIDDIGDYGQMWNYTNSNYSVEISNSGQLASIKITDNYSNKSPDISKLPTFHKVVKLMSSKKNADIANIVSPGIEIYYKNQTIFYKKSIRTEIKNDYSKVFQTIRELSKGLSKINTSDTNTYEENIRVSLGQNPKHVIKIKSGHTIKELVFEYINGQYLIWEINAK